MNRELVNTRKAKGISQYALSEKAGVHQTTLSAIELGKIKPSIELAERIADVLGVNINTIFKIQTVKTVVLQDPTPCLN